MKLIVVFFLILFLAGCKEVVHSDLKERDANEVVAVLYSHGISASKEALKDGLYSVSVKPNEFSTSVAILSKAGLPRETFSTMGDIFPDGNVVRTPFEERVRFAYALSQELSQTFTEIDGVKHARVHVVFAEKPRFQGKGKPSKVAVAIYHKRDFDAATQVPKMKTLLAFSVPDLTYGEVSVSLFPAGGLVDMAITPTSSIGAANATPAQSGDLPFLAGNDLINLTIIAAILLGAVALILRLIVVFERGYKRLFRHAR